MIVKKTVALNPVMDHFVRKTWAMLIEAGYDASYSTALNFMLLEHIRSVEENGIAKKVAQELNIFLNDEKAIADLDLEDYASKVDELIEQRDKSRDLK